jgi:hypothetical protein
MRRSVIMTSRSLRMASDEDVNIKMRSEVTPSRADDDFKQEESDEEQEAPTSTDNEEH